MGVGGADNVFESRHSEILYSLNKMGFFLLLECHTIVILPMFPDTTSYRQNAFKKPIYIL